MSDDNPYQPPQADVEPPEDDSVWALVEPRRCEAGRGWGWIVEGFRLFAASPGIWILNFFLFGLIMLLLSLVPIVSIAANILGPIFVAGFMLGARDLDLHGELKVDHLFAGFRTNAGKLAGLGALSVAFAVGIVVVMLILMFGVAGMSALDQAIQNPADLGMATVAVALVALGLSVPMAMAFWFAPALVVLNDVGVFDSLKMSFLGCLRNVAPFLIYGVVLFAVMLVAMLPLFLGLLVVVPVVFASIYVGYRDIFTQPR